jgi:ABC-2 type transport system permease protein
VFRRLWALLKVYIQDGLAYKAAGFIWVLTDVTTAVTMPLVWLSAGQGRTMGGYDPNGLVAYYLVLLMIGSFVTSHFMWEVSIEIREGTIQTHMVRPIGYLQFLLVRNLSWRLVRSLLFLPFFLAILWAYSSVVGAVQLNLGWEFFVAIVLGHLVSVTFVTAMALVAFYTTEAQAIFHVYYFPMLFLSGQLFPISLLPDWVRSVAVVFPFYYTTGVPTEIGVGRLVGAAAHQALAIQAVWIVVSVGLFAVLFRSGTRHYAGAGT